MKAELQDPTARMNLRSVTKPLPAWWRQRNRVEQSTEFGLKKKTCSPLYNQGKSILFKFSLVILENLKKKDDKFNKKAWFAQQN